MHNSRQCASNVGELVYHLQSLTFHFDGRLLVRLSRCWLIYHLSLFYPDCEFIAGTWIRYLIYIFSSVGAPFAMSSTKIKSSSTSVYTLDLACNLLRLKSFTSKQYLIGIPLSPSWKASVSMAKNIMLNSVEASTRPCLTPFVTRNGSETKPRHYFGPLQAYHRGTAALLLRICQDSQTLP